MPRTHVGMAEDPFVAECQTLTGLTRGFADSPKSLGWLRLCGHLGGGCHACHSALLARCRKALKKYNPPPRTADADDVSQIVFLKLLNHRWDPDRAPLGAWIGVLVQRIVIDEIRRADQQHQVIEDRPEPDLERAVRESSIALVKWLTPDGVAEWNDTVDRLRRALARLPFGGRQVLSLRFVEGNTLREIAEVLGRPLTTVHRQAEAALERLRRLMREGCDSS